MIIKFHCRGHGKNVDIVAFPPRHYILYFQIIISGQVDYYCSVLHLWCNDLILWGPHKDPRVSWTFSPVHSMAGLVHKWSLSSKCLIVSFTMVSKCLIVSFTIVKEKKYKCQFSFKRTFSCEHQFLRGQMLANPTPCSSFSLYLEVFELQGVMLMWL